MKCEVPLQNLLDHTVKRLMRYMNLHFNEDLNTYLKIIFKYGFDGTNSNIFKQKNSNEEAYLNSIFTSMLVPLQLVNVNTEEIYWTNPVPSSTRLCHPLKLLFLHETSDLCRQEEMNIQQQLEELQDITVAGWSVTSEMMLTMIDGKVIVEINVIPTQILIFMFYKSYFNDTTMNINLLPRFFMYSFKVNVPMCNEVPLDN